MKTTLKILILEDSPVDAEIIKRLLIKEITPCKIHLATNKVTFINALDEFVPDVILSDHSLPKFNSTDALTVARQKLPDVPFIMVTGTVSEEFAVTIIKMGADDYILKDRLARLPGAIKSALEQRRVTKEITDYKYALDAAAIVAITNQKGIILYANENFCKISKYSANELIGQDHRIINSGYHSSDFIKELWHTVAHGKIWRGEFCNRTKDGDIYWVETTIIPFLNEKGKPYQYLAIRYDITEKKSISEQLVLSEKKYRNIFLKSPLPNWLFDCETFQFLDVNEAAMHHYGYTHEEFLNMTIMDIRPPEEAQEFMKEIAKIREYPDSSYGTWVHRKKNGELIIVEITAHSIEYNKRKARMVVVNDITERKKAEEALRKSELRLNEAQSIAHISSYEVDLVNRIDSWSDEFYRLFGLNKEEATPSLDLFRSFVHPDDAEYIDRKINGLFQNFENSFLNFRFIRKDGKIRFGHSEWKFEFDKTGKPIRLFGILQDITERTEAEENLKLLEKKILEQRIQEQKKIARALIKGQEKERNHIGKELHDNINQILAGTKLFLSIAGNKHEVTKELVQYPMELIDKSMQEIRLLCQKLVTPMQNINLEALLRDLLGKVEETTTTKTKLSYELPENILSDDLQLNIYRIIQEQTNNILKYAEAKHVDVSLQMKEHMINIMVSDDGKGFDVAAKRKGIGILNMTNRAETFNGKVEINSSPGNGCIINIAIPC